MAPKRPRTLRSYQAACPKTSVKSRLSRAPAGKAQVGCKRKHLKERGKIVQTCQHEISAQITSETEQIQHDSILPRISLDLEQDEIQQIPDHYWDLQSFQEFDQLFPIKEELNSSNSQGSQVEVSGDQAATNESRPAPYLRCEIQEFWAVRFQYLMRPNSSIRGVLR